MAIRILTFTSLYPNSIQPNHGVFVEERMLNLKNTGEISYQVISPVPWFPFLNLISEKYKKYNKIPYEEVWNSITVKHPRYLMIPKIGVSFQALSMALCSISAVRKIKANQNGIDLLDAHYMYPDGVAAACISKIYRMPLIITARGTDVNVISEIWYLKPQIKWATRISDAIITVSNALSEKLIRQGVEKKKLHTIRNGVDFDKFEPNNTNKIRSKYNITGNLILSVGNLIESKGHGIVIEAVKHIPQTHLLIIGEGEYQEKLDKLILKLDLQNRVELVGSVDHSKMSEFYAASDFLILMSSREGMPNVVLESLACGTPVITTNVGDTKEVIVNEELGQVLERRSVDDLVNAINKQILKTNHESNIRQYAVNSFSWKTSCNKLKNIFINIMKINNKK